MRKNNKIWVVLAEVLVCQLRATLNPFNYHCLMQPRQIGTPLHVLAYCEKKMCSCFSLEFIVVLKWYWSNKCCLNKRASLQLRHIAITFGSYCLARAAPSRWIQVAPYHKQDIVFTVKWGRMLSEVSLKTSCALARKLFGLVCLKQVCSLF